MDDTQTKINDLTNRVTDLESRRVSQSSIPPQTVKSRHLEDNIIGTSKIQDGAVTNSKLAITSTYISPTLLNSWVWYGSDLNIVGYFKDSNNIVHLKGCIKSGTLDLTCFILPSGYRPLGRSVFPVNSDGAYGSCYIYANGEVKPHIGSALSFMLDGISFLAEQ